MEFEWDEAKARKNLKKHRILFETAALAFEDPNALMLPDRIVDEEERWVLVGMIPRGSVLAVVHTVREPGQGGETIRIISARKATSQERKLYGNRQV